MEMRGRMGRTGRKSDGIGKMGMRKSERAGGNRK